MNPLFRVLAGLDRLLTGASAALWRLLLGAGGLLLVLALLVSGLVLALVLAVVALLRGRRPTLPHVVFGRPMPGLRPGAGRRAAAPADVVDIEAREVPPRPGPERELR